MKLFSNYFKWLFGHHLLYFFSLSDTKKVGLLIQWKTSHLYIEVFNVLEKPKDLQKDITHTKKILMTTQNTCCLVNMRKGKVGIKQRMADRPEQKYFINHSIYNMKIIIQCNNYSYPIPMNGNKSFPLIFVLFM